MDLTEDLRPTCDTGLVLAYSEWLIAAMAALVLIAWLLAAAAGVLTRLWRSSRRDSPDR